MSVSDHAVAGLGAGTAGALIACPTELIKCRLQAQAGSKVSAAHIRAASLPAGLAALSQSGKGLASLTQAKGFSTLPLATATSGTTPGAIHLGDYTVSAPALCPVGIVHICLAFHSTDELFGLSQLQSHTLEIGAFVHQLHVAECSKCQTRLAHTARSHLHVIELKKSLGINTANATCRGCSCWWPSVREL